MKWLRLYTEIKDDPKMRKLADDEYRFFTYLLAIAAEEEKDGIVPYNTDDLSWTLRVPADFVERTIAKLMDLNILSLNGNGWKFINWNKRQYKSDNVIERVREWRAGKKSETLHETLHVTDRTEQNRAEQNRADMLSSPTVTETIPEDTLSRCVSKNECPHDAVVSLYHEILPELPAVKHWTPERQKQLRARWREAEKRQTLEWWRKYFAHVRESAFLMGKNKEKWTPNLEWLIKKAHLVNVIEGKYHGRTT